MLSFVYVDRTVCQANIAHHMNAHEMVCQPGGCWWQLLILNNSTHAPCNHAASRNTYKQLQLYPACLHQANMAPGQQGASAAARSRLTSAQTLEQVIDGQAAVVFAILVQHRSTQNVGGAQNLFAGHTAGTVLSALAGICCADVLLLLVRCHHAKGRDRENPNHVD